MKQFFGLSLWQFLGCFIVVFIALQLVDVLKLYVEFEKWQLLAVYFILYFGFLWVIDKLENIAFLAALDQKYSFSIFINSLLTK